MNPPVIHLIERILMAAGLAAMGHRREEGGHLFDCLGQFLCRLLEVLVETVVALPPGFGVSLPYSCQPKCSRTRGWASRVSGLCSPFGATKPVLRRFSNSPSQSASDNS